MFFNKNIKLTIFGDEDNLGSPNMGILSNSYKDFLLSLISMLKVEDLVAFKGFVSRKIIDKYLAETDFIYVSPSLHADENFGMSPFNILKNGGYCLLSDWGGFSEYRNYFSNQVSYLTP